MKRLRCLAAAAAVAAVPAVSHAVATVDPAGDLLSTYPGPRGGDLDVVSTDVLYNGNSFRFNTTLAAPVGTTPGGFYIWGLDRGQGTARFGQFTVGGNTYDARGVLFDSVVILRPGGPSQVVDLVAGTPPTTLAGSAVSFSGNDLTGSVAASLLPSLGLAPDQYTYNLWPRFTSAAVPLVGNAQITDFAPDNSNNVVSAAPAGTVPVPSTLTLGLLSLAIGVLLGKPRRAEPEPVLGQAALAA